MNDNPQNRRKNGVSKRISSPIVASESDSEPDSDLNSCSTTNTHCLRTSPTSFIESNPISKLVQADKHGRSVSFDGGCLPLPLLFDRRKRSLSSALLPRPLPMTPLDGPLSKPSQRLKLPLPPSALSCPKLSPNSQPESKSVPSFSNVFDYDGYSGFINETRSSTSGSKVARLVPKTNSVGFPGGADYKDCFGAPREPLMLQSHIPGRNEQYESIGPVIRSNEVNK